MTTAMTPRLDRNGVHRGSRKWARGPLAGLLTEASDSVSLASKSLSLRQARAEVLKLWRSALSDNDTELTDRLVGIGRALQASIIALDCDAVLPSPGGIRSMDVGALIGVAEDAGRTAPLLNIPVHYVRRHDRTGLGVV
jgi:hypothetical protein